VPLHFLNLSYNTIANTDFGCLYLVRCNFVGNFVIGITVKRLRSCQERSALLSEAYWDRDPLLGQTGPKVTSKSNRPLNVTEIVVLGGCINLQRYSRGDSILQWAQVSVSRMSAQRQHYFSPFKLLFDLTPWQNTKGERI